MEFGISTISKTLNEYVLIMFRKQPKYVFKPPADDPLPEAKIGVKSIDDNVKLKSFLMKEYYKKTCKNINLKDYVQL